MLAQIPIQVSTLNNVPPSRILGGLAMLFMFILSLLQSSLIVEMQEMSAGAAHQTVVVTTAAGNKVKKYQIVNK